MPAETRSRRHAAAERPGVAWTAARLGLEAAFGAAFRLRLAGLENVPVAGGALLAYNHVSVFDPIPVGLAAWRRGRRVRFLALAGDFNRPLVGRLLRATEQIPLRRGLGDWAAVEAVAEVLRAGGLAGMSPEGTVGTGHALQPGQRGAARIALMAQRPVIPVGVWGTQARWGKAGPTWARPWRPVCAVAFGPPIEVQGDARRRPDVLNLTDSIMAALEPVVGQARALASGA